MRLIWLLPLLVAATGLPRPADKIPPAGTFQGASSARLAKPVAVSFHDSLLDEPRIEVLGASPGVVVGDTDLPVEVLTQFALEAARRHFSDAEWDPALLAELDPRRAKRAKRKARRSKADGRLVLVRAIEISAQAGPTYTARVIADRLEGDRRLGQATGTGVAQPDRRAARQRAAFAPGMFGAVASRRAIQPNPDKDQLAIEAAVLRAFDSALLQLATYWSGEQAVEDAQRRARRR